ncbi:MAG: phosphonate metabolism transcriptional regulator PhnF [Pseudomonadota bacterium]
MNERLPSKTNDRALFAPLEKRAGVALWRVIAERFESEIRTRRLRVGDRLPTELTLAERFGVNRHTIRQAMKALEQLGWIRIERGIGTFVAGRPLRYRIGPRTRFGDNVREERRKPGTSILRVDTEVATADMARILLLEDGGTSGPEGGQETWREVWTVATLRVVDDVPVSLGFHTFSRQRFPALPQAFADSDSITDALWLLGCEDYTRVGTTVRARTADDQEVALLAIEPHDTVLVTEGVNVDAAGRPIEFSRAVLVASRVELSFGDVESYR